MKESLSGIEISDKIKALLYRSNDILRCLEKTTKTIESLCNRRLPYGPGWGSNACCLQSDFSQLLRHRGRIHEASSAGTTKAFLKGCKTVETKLNLSLLVQDLQSNAEKIGLVGVRVSFAGDRKNEGTDGVSCP